MSVLMREENASAEALSKLSKLQLRAEADKRGIRKGLSKNDMISAIMRHEQKKAGYELLSRS